MTEALLTEPQVADRLRVSLACLLRRHLERHGARFIKFGRSYGYLVVPPMMGNGAVGLQRVPVPIVMWNPVKNHRFVPLRLLGPAILGVAGEQGSILVCYEQLLSWPILQSAVQHPTLIVGLGTIIGRTALRFQPPNKQRSRPGLGSSGSQSFWL